MILRNRIVARVMSGFVMRDDMRLEDALAAGIARQRSVIAAAECGDAAELLSCLISDGNCANERDR